MNSPRINTIQEFAEFQAFCKQECDEGRCTKEEAVKAILDKAFELLYSVKVTYQSNPEQENKYQGVSYN